MLQGTDSGVGRHFFLSYEPPKDTLNLALVWFVVIVFRVFLCVTLWSFIVWTQQLLYTQTTCVRACVRALNYFSSGFAAGDSQAAPDNGGCFCYAAKLLTFPSYYPSIHLPPHPSSSLTLSETLSPAEHGCICCFPSQWRKHKIKPKKTSLCHECFFSERGGKCFVCEILCCIGMCFFCPLCMGLSLVILSTQLPYLSSFF